MSKQREGMTLEERAASVFVGIEVTKWSRGIHPKEYDELLLRIATEIREAVKKEREGCAVVAEEWGAGHDHRKELETADWVLKYGDVLAAEAIRARGIQEEDENDC